MARIDDIDDRTYGFGTRAYGDDLGSRVCAFDDSLTRTAEMLNRISCAGLAESLSMKSGICPSAFESISRMQEALEPLQHTMAAISEMTAPLKAVGERLSETFGAASAAGEYLSEMHSTAIDMKPVCSALESFAGTVSASAEALRIPEAAIQSAATLSAVVSSVSLNIDTSGLTAAASVMAEAVGKISISPSCLEGINEALSRSSLLTAVSLTDISIDETGILAGIASASGILAGGLIDDIQRVSGVLSNRVLDLFCGTGTLMHAAMHDVLHWMIGNLWRIRSRFRNRSSPHPGICYVRIEPDKSKAENIRTKFRDYAPRIRKVNLKRVQARGEDSGDSDHNTLNLLAA